MSASKYQPHQGKQEIRRRYERITRGRTVPHVVTVKPNLQRTERAEVVSHRREYAAVKCIKVLAKRDKRTGGFLYPVRQTFGHRLERAIPKVKGKANVKRAKKARQMARLRVAA